MRMDMLIIIDQIRDWADLIERSVGEVDGLVAGMREVADDIENTDESQALEVEGNNDYVLKPGQSVRVKVRDTAVFISEHRVLAKKLDGEILCCAYAVTAGA